MSFFNNMCEAFSNFLDFSEEEREFQQEYGKKDISFTQAELQFLKDYLAEELLMQESFKNAYKYDINFYWERSDINTAKGEGYFQLLNLAKNAFRKEKAKQKKLVAVQQKIKGMLKTL